MEVKMKKNNWVLFGITVLLLQESLSAQGALTVDRSRLVYNEGEKSVSVNVTNRNEKDPYLAQVWLENEKGEKTSGHMMVLPPLQRVEAGAKTVVRLQAPSAGSSLPSDRESVLYFNLREIPPKSDKANTLTLALQTRLKVFYRPKGLVVDPMLDTVPGTETLTLTRQGNTYVVNNPTPYHFTFVGARSSLTEKGVENFEPEMVVPKGTVALKTSVGLGENPVLIFVNDYGSQRELPFSCNLEHCRAGSVRVPPLSKSVANEVTEEKGNVKY